jgi:hypothetical protein
MEVLSRKDYADIIEWTPSGKAFYVINRKEFAARILPTHFKSAKYSSFTRKLHRWGFTRHYRGEEAGAYHHKCFRKDRLELVERMTCFREGDKPVAPTKIKEKTQSLTPRFTPVTTRKALSDVRPPIPSKFLPSVPSWSVNPPIQQSGCMHAPADLYAAIDIEVSLRLKERVRAAAMRREVLGLMQHQMKPPLSAYTDHHYLAMLQQGGVPSRLSSLCSTYSNVFASNSSSLDYRYNSYR